MSSHSEFGNIAFDLPKNQSNVIKVIGVGGGGSNAINHMYSLGIKGVDFVICNTDAQALNISEVPNKIQLGINLTEGLGAGANPEIGMQSAIESMDEIGRMLETNTKMIFITAGMGGGTGTGAAPIIAKMAKEMDILTVGIVTVPFSFEGKMRNEQAQKGVEELRQHVDSLIVINNNKLREVYGNLGFKAGFSKADEVLATASRGIAEVITHHYTQNIDLRDAKTVLSNSGTAIMGSAKSSGENRAQDAIIKALDSPLLNDNKIRGSKNVLLLIVSGSNEITLDEIGEINDHIQIEAGHNANIIMGVGEDASLEESIAVTIIATGFDTDQQDEISSIEVKRVIHKLEEESKKDNKIVANKIVENKDVISDNLAEEKTEVIRHQLEDSSVEESLEDKNEIITSESEINNINVVYEEVLDVMEEEEFNITEIHKNECNDDEIIEEQQTTFTFDFPIETKETNDDKLMFQLDNEVSENAVEQISETKTESHRIVHSLEDELSEPKEEYVDKDYVADLVFEKKVVPAEEEVNSEIGKIDPIHSSISQLYRAKDKERRQKMKEFNYKFNNLKIDEIEREPAYKRQGVTLDESKPSEETNMSRLSVETNEDGIQIKTNNSFLHDKPD